MQNPIQMIVRLHLLRFGWGDEWLQLSVNKGAFGIRALLHAGINQNQSKPISRFVTFFLQKKSLTQE
jgi:hypothetical protein